MLNCRFLPCAFVPGPFLRHIVALALGLAAATAQAGGFSVLPTRVQLSADRSLQSVTITNISSQSVTVESQVLVWPENAARQLASDIVVTPAVLTLPPGQRMRVRIGLLRPGDGQVERAYRLYFSELPAPSPLQGAGIGVLLRVGIPIFVAPLQAQPLPLAWEARLHEGVWQLLAHNRGNVHARLAELNVTGGEQATRLNLPSPYVLSGETARIALPNELTGPAAVPGSPLRLRWMDGDDVREGAVVRP